MSAPVQSLQPDIVERLRHGDARKCPWDTDAGNKIEPDSPCPVCGDFGNDAALNEPTKCVSTNQTLVMSQAASIIEQYRADQTRDESVIATLKARAEQAERAVDVLKAALREADQKLKEVIHHAKGNAKAAKIDDDEKTWLAHAKEVERASKSIRAALASKP